MEKRNNTPLETTYLKNEGDINLSDQRQKWQASNISPRAKAMIDKDAGLFLHQSLSTPCLTGIQSGEGASFTDVDGKAYLDFHGNNVHLLGYKNPYILNKVKAQLDSLAFSPRRYTNQAAIDFAQKLVDITPKNLNKVLFAPAGTIAMSTALKLARVVTGKHKVISMWDSFHGATMDSLSIGGEALFRKDLGPLMNGVFHVPPPSTYRGIFTDPDGNDEKYAEYIEYVIQKEGDIGAIVAETIRDSEVQIPSRKYWKKVRDICNRYEILLILDEIPISLGRTGKMFAFEHYGIEPDILALGKGLGGGVFPMAAIVAHGNLDHAQHTSLGHYTHEKSPVGSAAALATLEYIEKENLLSKVAADEKFMSQTLQTFKEKYEAIGDVRGMGLLWGIELVEDRATKAKAVQKAEKVLYSCLEKGLSFKVSAGNVLTLSPSLIISRADLERGLGIIEDAIKTVQ